ncbi:hypothetical protein GGS23DRAFT_426865 [Durotheca rogersii]|uniref:uncharacterized protein n=1 Tax=Durotheca rogersii TaxID=419775 RepID=UPI00222061AA|nr:uncharacterized protein GGS23DRAFT_426865 [Durotheca rogersii]KAI5865439.1 hypothetical protein GGS23DRAFT_426865 [Durotheca rogersii]
MLIEFGLSTLDKMASFQGFSHLDNDWQKNTTWENGGYQAAFTSNSTFGVINQFKFLAARSIRTSTIILSAFNTVAAFAVAAGIYYDCYTRARRASLEGKGKFNALRCVQGPSTYPFILSLGITVQGIVFAVSQARGLDGLFAAECSRTSQIMWPAIFIVPYIQLVLGLEVTIRAIKRSPFPPRGQWNIAICLGIFAILLIGTSSVGFIIRPPNFCFASLFWFVAKWAKGGFVVLVIITVILAVCGGIVFRKLSRYSMIEESERANASRMVYYMVLAVITNGLIAPFFIHVTFSDPMDDDGGVGSTLSMIATVVANVTGLTTGGLHLFLRASTIAIIRPKTKLAEFERQKLKQQVQVRGTTMDFNGHMLRPVSGPQYLTKTESQESLMNEKSDTVERGDGKFQFGLSSPNPLRSNAVLDAAAQLPRAPEPAQLYSVTPANAHSRKRSASYNIFPSNNPGNTASVALLQPTAYTPNPQPNIASSQNTFDDSENTLKPPPTIRESWYSNHRRKSSVGSSATVRIGLRLSNVADLGPMACKTSTDIERVYTLDCPEDEVISNGFRPSHLRIPSAATTVVPLPSPTLSRDTRMKHLPPIPARLEKENDCTLSPTVYDPNVSKKSKTASPRGVGFGPPPRANTTPVQDLPLPVPSRTPSRGRGSTTGGADNRPDWI